MSQHRHAPLYVVQEAHITDASWLTLTEPMPLLEARAWCARRLLALGSTLQSSTTQVRILRWMVENTRLVAATAA